MLDARRLAGYAYQRMQSRVLLVSAALIAISSATPARGATITVFSNADSGPGTLRQAIFDASSGDTINFAIDPALPHVVGLFSDELLINKSLTIDGPGADKLAVRNMESFRVFRVAYGADVTISGLAISNGRPPVDDPGGGIQNTGTLDIRNCAILSNTASSGGGIANFGFLTVIQSTISDNMAGMSSPGVNSYGGGIYSVGHTVITNSTISNNQVYPTTTLAGGGIANVGSGSYFEVRNSTISGNTASACGGGIFATSNGGTSTIIRSAIIARNDGVTGPDVCGSVSSQGFNLVSNNADALITPAQSSDLIGTPAEPIDPLIGPLQYNGGPTYTCALQSNSPAVNRGYPVSPLYDQRGYYRAGVADIGAFEFGGTVPVSLGNISTRLTVETGNNVLIGGFIITGSFTKKVIVRAIGPSLSLPGVLANPILELHNSSGALIAINDNWRSDQEAEIIATGIPPTDDLESAIVTTLPANNSAYTAIVRGVNNGTGIGVVEAYDLNRTVDSKLGNISTRGLVQTGDNVLIAGTIVVGQTSQRVILRAIGPSLNLGGEQLSDPTLELHDGNGDLLAYNDNWRTDQEAEIIATGIPPTSDLESAIVWTLAPSNYTAIVRGVNDGIGIAVVEAYAIP